ncbi:MAG: PDZ domain-containing protein [Candidatus Eisenbacteria bacterium]|nr:PDZ domain-containing protein [Candidatus Eisenbacteria bacterium]
MRRSVVCAALLSVALLAIAAPAAAQTEYIITLAGDAGPMFVGDVETADHGWLGVTISDAIMIVEKKADLSGDTKYENSAGVRVDYVYEGSPAETAGLEPGDVIVAIDGEKSRNTSELTETIRKHSPGDKVELTVIRGEDSRKIMAELGSRQEHVVTHEYKLNLDDMGDIQVFVDKITAPYVGIGMSGWGKRGRLGVFIDELSDGLAEYFEVPNGKGVLVEEVVEDSPAEEGGIEAGDIIIRIGGERITDTEELVEAIAEMEADVETDVVVWRRGGERKLQVTVGESPYDKYEKEIQEAIIEFQEGFKDYDDQRILVRHMTDEEKKELQIELKELRKELEELKADLKENLEGLYENND